MTYVQATRKKKTIILLYYNTYFVLRKQNMQKQLQKWQTFYETWNIRYGINSPSYRPQLTT